AALAELGRLVGAVGHVLPMSPLPLDLVGEADRFDPADPDRVRQIRGQSSIAATPGRVLSVRLLPAGAPACAAAVDAVREADAVVLGPGSWFTSVIPHLLLRELGRALVTTRAKVIVTLNLVPQVGETDQYQPHELVRLLRKHAEPLGELRVDHVLADADAVLDPQPLADYVAGIGARLILSRLAADSEPGLHDPDRLAAAIAAALEQPAGRATTVREGVH
ncbi:MAG: gluconeogenesis factor YvcK family protein, partial [Jatrophihabitans sp.]|uniref:gluconeogenesis factor YvcK family protein n=1 Tax=Jatrophihabitans sp. TaxID=1932789 RepID=UPI003F81D498